MSMWCGPDLSVGVLYFKLDVSKKFIFALLTA